MSNAQVFRRALLITAISLAAWLAFNHLRVFKHPFGDLAGGTYTDHLSHMNAARAFPRVGLDIWRKSAIQLSRPPTPAEEAAFPADVHPGGSWKGGVYMMDGWPPTKPWVTSWGHKPRLYPPGDMILVAPVAVAYHFTSLSLTGANRWLFSIFLVYAHVAIFFIVLGVLEEKWRPSPMLVVVALSAYILIIFWTLQGFYDAAAVGPLLLSARYLRERRGLAAAVAYAVGAFIHFRALFLAPWAVYAVWIFVNDRQWRSLRGRDYVAMVAGAVCGGATLTALALVAPTLSRQDVNNSINLSVASAHPGAVAAFSAVVLVAGGLVGWAQGWLDLAMLVWLTGMWFRVNEAHEWHVVVWLAWLVAPVWIVREGKSEWVRAARLLLLGYVAFRVMVN